MKSKQQILKAIKTCKKMKDMNYSASCSTCPYRNKKWCFNYLLDDLEYYVHNDAWTFIKYLEDHPDYILKDDTNENEVASVIDVDHLLDKFEKMKEQTK